MCGIFCVLSCKNNKEYLKAIYEKCEANLKRRGPDDANLIFANVRHWNFLLASSVLWLQGLEITKQPIETEKSWFLYNGDIFDSEILAADERHQYGDTKLLLHAIENADSPMCALSKMYGPFAFILIDKINLKLYFARDTYGRRSLLIGKEDNELFLSSVAVRHMPFKLLELPALGVYCVDLTITNITSMTLYPWQSQNQHFPKKLDELQTFLSVNILCETNASTLDNERIHSPSLSDTLTLETMHSMQPDKAFAFIRANEKWMTNVIRVEALLEDAVKRRIEHQPKFCKRCIRHSALACDHSSVGILFSGGLDCAVVSMLADRFLEPHRAIDLLNVAFERGNSYDGPDRVTARQTLAELRRLRPQRTWNLLEINVPPGELNTQRIERVSDLIHPLQSILDESLGCALWFAARGQSDHSVSPCRVEANQLGGPPPVRFKPSASVQVLLVGMGADELFGGYSRHRAAYKRGGWPELTRELDTDWKNISHRNLARDDRVVSDHGRQLRTPYLDENVVGFVRQLSAWDKCYPSEKVMQGLGDKLLLRTVAHHLGLTQAAALKKRALQFGSRIANRRENAHDKSPRL